MRQAFVYGPALRSLGLGLGLVLGILALGMTLTVGFPGPAEAETMMREDGIHTESWINGLSFLELREDLEEAKDSGKGLVILFEQPGCGACERLHEVNFADSALVEYITQHFNVLQINLYGAKTVTDFDGEELEERAFAEKKLIHFTPTTLFLGADGEELFRVPGYLALPYYRAAFEYVVDEGPQKGILFPRWSKQRREAEKEKSGS